MLLSYYFYELVQLIESEPTKAQPQRTFLYRSCSWSLGGQEDSSCRNLKTQKISINPAKPIVIESKSG